MGSGQSTRMMYVRGILHTDGNPMLHICRIVW